MNEGQKMFYEFIMNIAKEGKKSDAEKILTTCFKKQEEGTFDKAYLEGVMPKLREIVKEEIDKLDQAMNHFASHLKG